MTFFSSDINTWWQWHFVAELAMGKWDEAQLKVLIRLCALPDESALIWATIFHSEQQHSDQWRGKGTKFMPADDGKPNGGKSSLATNVSLPNFGSTTYSSKWETCTEHKTRIHKECGGPQETTTFHNFHFPQQHADLSKTLAFPEILIIQKSWTHLMA